ncbi:MAG: hypothetical protein Q7K42_03415 [Candidatus Diapherotrites archaeon]|nr:hypothetical protein [Candidatus Diapherotrites archaeon]
MAEKITISKNSKSSEKFWQKPNVVAALSYFPFFPMPLVIPLILYLTLGQENKSIKFHSAQSLVIDAVLFVAGFIAGIIGGFFFGIGMATLFIVIGIIPLIIAMIIFGIFGIVSLIVFFYKLYLMYKAYKNEPARAIFAADFTDRELM